MTIKEAILKSLEKLPNGGTTSEVYQHIIKNNYYQFDNGKTPIVTVSAQLGSFIRKGDARIKRSKNANNIYYYYLSSNNDNNATILQDTKKGGSNYNERDLHPLLCTYLKQNKIHAKTIYHEKSNRKDEHQKWIHPDIIGVKFSEFKNESCQSLFKSINGSDTIKFYSYELKKDLTNDYDLKKCFFQAVSNSSWANYGYLVAFDIDDRIIDEIERLNHSFGIGVIKLKANPYESQIIFPAKHKTLDFKTLEKLCNINDDFNKYINKVEKIVTAGDKYIETLKKDLYSFCDDVFKTDSEIIEHCKTHKIPITDENI